MEVGNVVWFPSRRHPFVIQTVPCLDLDCPCSNARLTLTEVRLQGPALAEPLSFELNVCLRHWQEHEPTERGPEVDRLALEFMATFPEEQIRGLAAQWNCQRAIQRRLAEYTIDDPASGELVCYSDVIHEAGGVTQTGKGSYFFVHQGRSFLLEDYYCPNPQCDCQRVHVEFWKRGHREPEHRIAVEQFLRAALTLNGQLDDREFSREPESWARRLVEAWRAESGHQFEEFRRRYQQVKTIGKRTFRPRPRSARLVDPAHEPLREPASKNSPPSSSVRAGRNDPCPCGSGLKFKRCCARRQVRG